MKIATFAMIVVFLSAAISSAQLTRTVGITGSAEAGTSFTLQVEAVAPGPTICYDFAALAVDYSAPALAQLIVSEINFDFRANGKMGFEAQNPTSGEGTKFDATFEILSAQPLDKIRIGMLGMPTLPIPRAPSVSFNPSINDYESQNPGFYVFGNAGHPNANLTINGIDPADDFFRIVDQIAGETVQIVISSGTNMDRGILLFSGPMSQGGVYSTPWGDTVDVGVRGSNDTQLPSAVSILGDGLFNNGGSVLNAILHTRSQGTAPFTFSLSFSVPLSSAGTTTTGLQAVLSDPTNPPFNLRTTQAGRTRIDVGQRSALVIGSDGVVPVPFITGRTFNFYGIMANQAFVHENGLVSFGMSSVPGMGPQIDPVGVNMGVPAIAVNYADWDVQGSAMGSRLFVKAFGNEIRFQWGQPDAPISHFGDNDSANFECILQLDSDGADPDVSGAILLAFRELDRVNAQNRNESLVGITPGGGLNTSARSLDLGIPRFASQSSGSLLDQDRTFNASQFVSALPVDSSMVPQVYNNGSAWSERTVGFFPPTMDNSPLGNFYYSIASDRNPDDLAGSFQNGMFQRTGVLLAAPTSPQIVTLVGYFQFVYSGTAAGTTPSVVLDPNNDTGQGPITVPIAGVFDSSGFITSQAGTSLPVPSGFRDFEGLQFVNNGVPFPPGTSIDVAINFGVTVIPSTTVLLPQAFMIM